MKYSLQKRISAFVLAFALVMTTAFNSVGVTTANAAALKCKSLSANKSSVSVVEGSSVKVTVTQKFNKKSKAKISVSSSNKSVATVSKKLGKKAKSAKATLTIKGVAAGTATITVKSTKKTKKTKKITVTVKAKETATTAAPATTQSSADATTGAIATTEAPASSNASDNALKKVTLSTTNPKVGDVITVVLEPTTANDVKSYTWYEDDVAVSGNATSSYTVTEKAVGKKIRVTVTNTAGTKFESNSTAAVVVDNSKSVTINDLNGFQADGTALNTDNLSLIFGDSLGLPKTITWYVNNSLVKSFNSAATAITDEAIGYWGNSSNPTGSCYAKVVTENGEYTTPTITIVKTPVVATLSNVKISEDYATPAVALAKETDKFVVSVTLNKNYSGKFYLVEADKDITTDNCGTGYATASANAKTDSKYMTEANALAGGLKRSLETKEVQYMFKAPKALTRGKEYKVVFEQAGVDSAAISKTANKTAITSDAVLAAYVKAPTKIAVTNPQTKSDLAGWTATVYAGDDKCEYITVASGDYAAGTAKATLTANTSTSTTNGTPFGKTGVEIGQVTKGVFDGAVAGTCYGSADNSYVYAKFEGAAGVFGKDKLELTSTAVKTATSIVSSASLAVSTKNVKDVDFTLNNLVASADVYLLTAKYSDNGVKTAFDAIKAFKDKKTKVGVVSVGPGNGSATLKDAISKVSDTTNGDVYTIAVIPQDEKAYAPFYGIVGADRDSAAIANKDSAILVTQIETTLELANTTVSSSNGDPWVIARTNDPGTTPEALIASQNASEDAEWAKLANTATVKFLDQYGNAIAESKRIEAKVMPGVERNAGNATVSVYMSRTGKLSFKPTKNGGASIGDVYTFTLSAKFTLQATVKTLSTDGNIDTMDFVIVAK